MASDEQIQQQVGPERAEAYITARKDISDNELYLAQILYGIERENNHRAFADSDKFGIAPIYLLLATRLGQNITQRRAVIRAFNKLEKSA